MKLTMEQAVFSIAPLIFILLGAAIFFAPPKSILSWDRRTGYWIYKQKLKSTGDEEEAVRAAGVFYKWFGAVFALFALMFFLMALFSETPPQ